MIQTISDLVGLGFFIFLCSGSVVLLTAAAFIPYWSKTDRMWKCGEEEAE